MSTSDVTGPASAVAEAAAPSGRDAASTPDRVVPKRPRRHGHATVRLLQVLVAVVVLGGWEALVRARVIDEFFFPLPTDVAVQVGDWLTSGFIYPHLWVTIQEALYAFIIGSILGLGLGFFLARSDFAAAVLDPYLKMFNALPRVVLAPIFLLWFGLGIWSKVAFGVTLVFFIVFFNTLQGVRNVDKVLINNARMLGANERQLMRHVLLPSALTWIFSSLHISVGFAITGAVVGEYLGASAGVGYVIAQAEGVFDTTGVFAGMIVLMLVVLVVDVIVNRVETRLLRWQPQTQK
ncbi:ABC transporter permease [Aeromicrobium sp.]|uniref:ABC transporter permease n=1 Tax=Aeromicrobium sp. TaxID=1871063 RepID=UPI0025C2D801|nr:ABC transporter permease [Aeromicrobium sp.]